ncbi:hypothetical protein [Methylobacterium haplocladii]|uniref:Uncharacterized protein n=1 Tax=Methylobacterium haplocladii TaxID=1176176 RepID=A0A512IS88_9HYPH|nr:hypothetical protein [Methylobacterium haplocladii]GEP00570.1 hypothetical protein MHA02_29570 [Methylobacterium haplocladii]GJD85485.1 hypothetical protein HPGCJGGD_3374 [Methylobacterium haplocladii]GLS57718.1 hypothetical protein GCM10007887_03740 [Methylobacterium haplocladii]
MADLLDDATALRLVADGRKIPRSKFTCLVKRGLIRLRGHGAKTRPVLTGSGEAALRTVRRAARRARPDAHAHHP